MSGPAAAQGRQQHAGRRHLDAAEAGAGDTLAGALHMPVRGFQAGATSLAGRGAGGGVTLHSQGLLDAIPDLARPASGTLRSAGSLSVLPVGVVLPASPVKPRASAASGAAALAAVGGASAGPHAPAAGTGKAGAGAPPGIGVPGDRLQRAAATGESFIAVGAVGSVLPGSGVDFAARAAARRADAARSREAASRPGPVGLTGSDIPAPQHLLGLGEHGGGGEAEARDGRSPSPHPPRTAPNLDREFTEATMGSAVAKRPRDRAVKAAAVTPHLHSPPPPFGQVAHFEEGEPSLLLQPRGARRRGRDDDDDMLVLDGSVAGDEEDGGEGSGDLDAVTGQLLPSRARAVASAAHSPASEYGEGRGSRRPSRSPSPQQGPPTSHSQKRGGGSAGWGPSAHRHGSGSVQVASTLLSRGR